MTAHLEDWEKARLAYADAELYRLVVARTLVDGAASCKAEFDALVRKLGDIEECDKIIAFRNQRPGCIAGECSGRYECPCGVSWAIDEPNPPGCRQDDLS
jgi:hypothetical protein